MAITNIILFLMLYSLAESQTTKEGTKNFKGAFTLKFHGSSVKHHKPVVYSERQYYWGTWTWDEKKNVDSSSMLFSLQ